MAVIGKTNVPEFLSGAETTNDLFGPTRNPWDPALTCGASSGGAAASVASGTSWLAHGEDTAGSIRIPAAFCGVVGLRTTPGLVPTAPTADPVPGFTVHGPIARDVDDALLMLQAMSPSPLIGSPPPPAGSPSPTGPAPTRLPLLTGPSPTGSPLSGPSPSGTPRTGTPSLTRPSPSGTPIRRIGYSPDLGGRVPIDPSIAAVCAQVVAALGDRVSLAEPAVDGWHEACLILLAHRAAVLHGPRVDRCGDRLGAGIRAEIEAGRSLTPQQLASAWEVHAAARNSARRGLSDARSTARDDARPGLFDVHDVIVTPAFGVLPWRPPADLPTVAASWPLMTVATMAGCPALVVPCGVTEGGLPVALQLIGPPGSDVALLHLGREIEQLRTMPDLPLSRVPTPL